MLCGEVSRNVLTMSSDPEKIHNFHKEETPSRIEIDKADRKNLRSMLDTCINPLDSESHSDGALINIVTGEIAHADANVDDALDIVRQGSSC